jgi:peptide/nickel transport system ATP-binding protein
MTALLTVKDLSVKANGKPLVSGLSFTIHRGERVGLIGESGSGKSLTSLAVTGLLPAGLRSSGSVVLAGQEVVGASERQLNALRGRVAAIVFQEPLTALDPLMRAGKQVSEPLMRRARQNGETLDGAQLERAVLTLLEEMALPDPARIARSYPHEMSGGQRQRVAIAMALACRPELLIADEPTTALDVTTQAEILALLDRLVRERNMALLFISHDLPVVANTVERVVVLKAGETVEAGPVSSVFATPQHPYTQSLLAAARSFDSALEGRS